MNKIRFLHIPKTAGSTFMSILRNQYGKQNCYALTGNLEVDRNNYNKLSSQDREKIALFSGHAPITTGINEVDEATTITLLRDPIERVISFCQHVSEGKSPYLIETFPPENFNIDRFLDSNLSELSNLQTKFLADNKHFTFPDSIVDHVSLENARDSALDTLFNRIFRYGLMEYFDESLVNFSTALGWKTPYYKPLNVRNRKNLIRFEKHHIARIMEMNAIDIQVYREAKVKFHSMRSNNIFEHIKVGFFRINNYLH